MLVVFGSAKILEELFERLGQPGIVGQIRAGIVIGPSVLGWISPNEFTAAMAQLGVMFLLFRVGLEVDAAGLMRTGVSALSTGILGVAIPFASGWAFYKLWGPGLEAVFLGTALTATSVGITAQVLAARGLLHRTAAKIILGAAVIDDILALLLLGFVSSIAEGTVNLLELAVTTGLALGFVVVVAHGGTQAIGHVLAKLEGKLRRRGGVRAGPRIDVRFGGCIRQDRSGSPYWGISCGDGAGAFDAAAGARTDPWSDGTPGALLSR